VQSKTSFIYKNIHLSHISERMYVASPFAWPDALFLTGSQHQSQGTQADYCLTDK